MVLFFPSLLVSIGAAALTLYLTNPAALWAISGLFTGPAQGVERAESLGDLAPILVKINAPGLPPEVAVAVKESNLLRAGELLSDYRFNFSMSDRERDKPLASGTIRVEVEKLIPRVFRWICLFGVAALYFTFFTSRGRSRTLGKWLLGIQVVRLDGGSLTSWEGFERFGGYFATMGTFGLGLIDFWKDPNRRLAHDRIAGTVVVMRKLSMSEEQSGPDQSENSGIPDDRSQEPETKPEGDPGDQHNSLAE